MLESINLKSLIIALFISVSFSSQIQDRHLLYEISIDSTNRNNNYSFKNTPKYIKAIYLPNKKYQIPEQFPVEYYKGKTVEDCLSAVFFELTGYIENKNEFWIHPPRDGDYLKQMELLPFPNIKYNKKKWKSNLEIGSYFSDERWAVWKGDITLHNKYKLTNKNYKININNREYNCIEITATMSSKIGKTKSIFYFNENVLVKSIYSMLNGDRLEMTLIK